jgi:DNA relaxase NicK
MGPDNEQQKKISRKRRRGPNDACECEGDQTHNKKIKPTSMAMYIRSNTIHNAVENTIREILGSDKTEQCFEQERKRNELKEISVFARGLREVGVI